MRIAIISGYFVSGRGYQENLWAEELAKYGHKVCVFTSKFLPRGLKHDFTTQPARYEVKRVAAIRLPSSIILTPHLTAALYEFAPDLVFWIGVGQFFGWPLLKAPRLQNFKTIAFFGENLRMHEFNFLKPGIGFHQRLQALGFNLLRRRFYLEVFRHSYKVIATKAQTIEILTGLCMSNHQREALKKKLVNLPLGFSPDLFFPDFAKRETIRKKMGIDNESILVITSSRFSPGKKIAQLLEHATKAINLHEKLMFCLVGFIEGDRTSEIINRKLDRSSIQHRLIKHPFCSRKELAGLFNAADVGLFHNPTISVQEAMGTGLFMCLSNDGSMNHLINIPSTGILFDASNPRTLTEALLRAADIVSIHRLTYKDWRQSIYRKNARLSYRALTARLMSLLESSDN